MKNRTLAPPKARIFGDVRKIDSAEQFGSHESAGVSRPSRLS